jgi:hypothetical protein
MLDAHPLMAWRNESRRHENSETTNGWPLVLKWFIKQAETKALFLVFVLSSFRAFVISYARRASTGIVTPPSFSL